MFTKQNDAKESIILAYISHIITFEFDKFKRGCYRYILI